jgi:hypothetical protein
MPIIITRDAQWTRTHIRCANRCGGESTLYRPLAETDAEAAAAAVAGSLYLRAGSEVFCGVRCRDHAARNAEQDSFSVTGDELTARQRATPPELPAVYQRERDALAKERTAVCSRCKTALKLQTATYDKGLEALGWRLVGGALFCSRDCWSWHTSSLAATQSPTVMAGAGVAVLPDASYQARRQELQAAAAAAFDPTPNRHHLPALQPGEALPVPPPAKLGATGETAAPSLPKGARK